MILPMTWIYVSCFFISTQASILSAEFHDIKPPRTVFFVMTVKQRFMQTEFNIHPVLVRRRPKEVLLAWLISITQAPARAQD